MKISPTAMPSPAPNSLSKATTNSAPSKLPEFLLLLGVLLYTARWIWIGGRGDYGWTYEAGWRIAHGESQYADFVTLLPPLTNYTLAGLLWMAGDSLWIFAIHLYLWWIAALWVGLRLLRRLSNDTLLQSAAILVALVLSYPASTLGHAYNYAATFFVGLEILFVLDAFEGQNPRAALWAGIAGAMGLWAKQNVGLAVSFIAGAGLLAEALFAARESSRWRSVVRFSIGFLLGVAPFVAFFIAKAGVHEFWTQFLGDGSRAKGGLVRLILNMVPAVTLPPQTPHWRGLELVSTASVAGLSAWIIFRQTRASGPEVLLKISRSQKMIWITAIIVGAISILSLFDLGFRGNVYGFLENPYADWVRIGISAVYIFCTIGFMIAFWRLRTAPLKALISLLGAALMGSFAMSSGNYLPFAAPVVLPLFFVSLHWTGFRSPLALAAALAIGLTILQFVGRPFSKLEPFPANTPFAGLWADSEYVQRTRMIFEHITPVIHGHTALWMTSGGPHSAFGGLPVKNVASYFADTYNPREEGRLEAEWRKTPPEFIVTSYFRPAEGAKLLTPIGIVTWLKGRYEVIWESPRGDLKLWRKL
jgi:hypothetical protein